jgi:hypothetical protein
VAGDGDEAQPLEAIVQFAGPAWRRGEFDEFEAVDRHRIGERRGLHAKIGGWKRRCGWACMATTPHWGHAARGDGARQG